MRDPWEMAQCDTQGQLFELSAKRGYASEAFIKAFMNSDVAKDLDMPFHHMQWAGTHYLMSRMEEEHTDALTHGEHYDTETLYWAGYLYRYWHIYTGESSREILKQASAKTMRM